MFGKHETDVVNKQLKDTYGCELDGKPKFRVVWSEGQTEIRVGEHKVFSESGKIWLRNEYGARLCRKYNYVKNMFILEKLEYYRNPEVLRTEAGSYEPIWVFRDGEGNALDPIMPACRIIIDSNYYNKEKETKGDIVRADEAQKKSDFDYNLDVIQNNSPYLATMMHNKEAKFQDSTKEFKPDEMHSGKPSSLPTEGSKTGNVSG
jgi:hypothetical protein